MLAFSKEQYGNIASVVGLLVSLVGFAATIGIVRKARRAAEEARQAAREAVFRIKSQLLSDEIEASIRIVRDVDRSCREKQWEAAGNSCDEARSRLSQFPRDERPSDQDCLFLDSWIETLGGLMPYFEQLRVANGSRGLSATKSDQIHRIITGLGRIYGRLRVVSLEV